MASKFTAKYAAKVSLVLSVSSQHSVEGIGSLVNEGFGIVRIGVEIFESEEPVVAGFFESIGDRRPVGRPVEQGTKGFEGVVGAFLGELLEVDVLDAVAKLANPVFGELKHHDVAGVEVDFDVIGLKAVHKFDHLSRSH